MEERVEIQPAGPGRREHSSWWWIVAAVVAVALIVALVVAQRRGENTNVSAIGPPQSSTTTVHPTTTTSTTLGLILPPITDETTVPDTSATTATTIAPPAPAGTDPAATPPPAPPPSGDPCRNSYDPACGPFQWNVGNAPLNLNASAAQTPCPDGVNPYCVFISGYNQDDDAVPTEQCATVTANGQVLVSNPCNTDGCFDTTDKYGTWDAPPPEPGQGGFSFGPFAVPGPGPYDYVIDMTSGNPYCAIGPYSSATEIVVHIDVA